MKDDPKGTTVPEKVASVTAAQDPVVNETVAQERATEARTKERKRQKEIRALARTHDLGDAWADKMCDGDLGMERINAIALEEIAQSRDVKINVGEDLNLSTLADAVEDSIAVRAGCPLRDEDGAPRKPHTRAREFRGMSLLEGARKFFSAHGINTDGMSRAELAKFALAGCNPQRPGIVAAGAPYANVAGDYPKILENIVTKRLRNAYEENTGTWATPGLMRRRTVPDFKTVSVVALGAAVDLKEVREGATYEEATIPETREKYSVTKYGVLYSLTWEQMVNDDTDAFDRIPALHGAAAARLENVRAWNPITSAALGATLDDDSTAIFDAGHGNLVTAGGAPATATLAVGRQNMREQTAPTDDGSVAYLNLSPNFIVVPPDLEQVTRELVETSFKSDASIPGVVNTFRNLVVIAEPLIGTVPSSGGSGWYLFANSAQIDTIEVAFLEGNEAPFLDSEDGFSSDGRRYKVRHVIGSKAIDYRGMWHNDGVA
jgi:hypothetical protein